jgi:acetyltransferase-like isoleucine patch superfamily enzyme
MILHAVGLDDWVCTTIDGYVACAIAAASDLNALAEMRMALRPRFIASPLHDAAGLARAVEAAYRTLWDEWHSGRKPDGRANDNGGPDMLSIAPSARISPLADIEASVRGSRIVIEADVTIDAFVKIKSVGWFGDVVIGRGTVINSGCVLYTGNGISIGRNVLIAGNCTLAPINHAFMDPDKPIREQGFQPSRRGIVIGDDVWIGANLSFWTVR